MCMGVWDSLKFNVRQQNMALIDTAIGPLGVGRNLRGEFCSEGNIIGRTLGKADGAAITFKSPRSTSQCIEC